MNVRKGQQFFPFLPDYSSWDEFNGNLVLFYSQTHIPFAPEDEWQKVAREIAQSAAFQPYGTPDPQTYNSWQDWANEFANLVNGPLKR